MTKRISTNAIQALIGALATVFWYKSDLRTFLVAATGNPSLVASLNWDEVKWRIADEFVQNLAANQEQHRDTLIQLMLDISAMDSFPKLRGLEDEDKKVATASAAVAQLNKYIRPYEEEALENAKTRERIVADGEAATSKQHFQDQLSALRSRYQDLTGSSDPQQRGRDLEDLIRDVFILFDLDPRASFVLKGEQIDGSFTLGESHFLLEAKWTNDTTERKELDAFRAKIETKIENTLGLFVSINGFQPTAVELHSRRGANMLLMTGADLYLVLDGRIDLTDLLKRKYRHASQTGEILFEAHQML
jgi:hypothetical protein